MMHFVACSAQQDILVWLQLGLATESLSVLLLTMLLAARDSHHGCLAWLSGPEAHNKVLDFSAVMIKAYSSASLEGVRTDHHRPRLFVCFEKLERFGW